MRKFAHDGIREGDCDARRRSSRRKIALSRARSISRSIGATPQPRRPRRNCASSAAFHSRAAESVSCTVCRMCGGVCEYVRHAAEFMRFRCPACARRRIYSARGAYRAGRGCFRNLQIEFRCFNNVNQNRNGKNTYFRSIAAVYRLFPRQMMESKPPRRSRIRLCAGFPQLEHLRSFAPVPVPAFPCLVPSVSVFLHPRTCVPSLPFCVRVPIFPCLLNSPCSRIRLPKISSVSSRRSRA